MAFEIKKYFNSKKQTARKSKRVKKDSDFRALTKLARRVLVIDDDRDTAQSIKYVVESKGHSVCDVVCDVYEALLALSDSPYDLVFIDQKMPGLDGSSVLSKADEYADMDPLIVESGRFARSIPAVLMSGTEISLKKNYELKNFKLVKLLNKKDLFNYLSLNFAS